MRTKECKECGETKMLDKFPPTNADYRGKKYLLKTCYKCRTKMRKENKEKWNSRAYTGKTYKCVHDPESEEWYKDSEWHKGMVDDTLKDGHWVPGMWFLDQETGTYYEVRGNEEWYKVECYFADRPNIPNENNLKPESQRLVRSYGKHQPPGGR